MAGHALCINLAAIEFTLGTCMLLGVYRRYASFLTLLMMCFMTPLTLYLALYNPVADCGCFGEALVLTNWETFYKNIVLLAAAFVAFRFNQRVQAGYSYKVQLARPAAIFRPRRSIANPSGPSSR